MYFRHFWAAVGKRPMIQVSFRSQPPPLHFFRPHCLKLPSLLKNTARPFCNVDCKEGDDVFVFVIYTHAQKKCRMFSWQNHKKYIWISCIMLYINLKLVLCSFQCYQNFENAISSFCVSSSRGKQI